LIDCQGQEPSEGAKHGCPHLLVVVVSVHSALYQGSRDESKTTAAHGTQFILALGNKTDATQCKIPAVKQINQSLSDLSSPLLSTFFQNQSPPMTIFQLPVFGSIFSTTSRPDRLRKSIGPISAVLKRQQPFATTSNRQTPHKPQGPAPGETVTEGYILNSFPRPNLSPTLHLRLGMFGSTSTSADTSKDKKAKCSNCAGPHSSDFCPC